MANTTLIFIVDALFRTFSPPVVIEALMDEPAHAATTSLFLLGARGYFTRPFALAAIAGSVVIDIDHIPLYLGWDLLTPEAGRPYTHSLSTVLGGICLAAWLTGRRRQIALGAAFGLAAHLLRDLATGNVWLLWPLPVSESSLPYGIYAAVILALLLLVLLRRHA